MRCRGSRTKKNRRSFGSAAGLGAMLVPWCSPYKRIVCFKPIHQLKQLLISQHSKMASTRFFTLIALAFGAAQLAQAGVIPANNLSGSPTDYSSSFPASSDAPAPTDFPQDGNPPNATLGYMPSFSPMPHSVRKI